MDSLSLLKLGFIFWKIRCYLGAGGGIGKPSFNRAFSTKRQTRNRVIYPWAGWTPQKCGRRPEPVDVAISSDDLWIAVKCQTNPEIAGSPRKVYRDRGTSGVIGGRATEWDSEGNRVISTKLRITMYTNVLNSRIGLSWCGERETSQTLS